MKTAPRLAVLSTTLAVAMTIPVAAIAKPVSTYELRTSFVVDGYSGSVVVAVDEAGASDIHFQMSRFEMVNCDGVLGTVTSTWSAEGSADEVEFSVNRKLDAVGWSGTAPVSVTVSTYCPDTGIVEQAETTTGTFAFDGTSSEKVSRTRIDGNRVLSSTLDVLALSVPGLSTVGVGQLTETISKST
jgi:hypothetical protein